MAKAYDFFSGSQEDINRRLLRKILALEAKVGTSSTGLVKAVGDLETAVGDAEGGLVKDVADINTEIGDDDTQGTIKGRIKVLEDG